MDNIRFRAWDKKDNKIRIVTNLFFDFETRKIVEVQFYECWIDGGYMEDEIIERNIEDVELMQFTGSTDKNGQEIYKSHILKIPDYYLICDDGSGPVYEESHLAEVVYSNKYACYGVDIKSSGEIFSKGFTSFHEIIGEGVSFKIIGNKFENPELIT